jgi:regulatory protein
MKAIPNIKSYAFKLLGIRSRSEGELRARLKDKGYDPGPIDEIIDHLKAIGLIDDRKTAESILRYCRERKMLGENGSKYYLKKRGIPDEIIGQMSFSPDEQVENAKILIGKKEKYLKKLPLKVKINRLYGQLRRKGYGSEVIQKAMREYEGLRGPEEPVELEPAELEKADRI